MAETTGIAWARSTFNPWIGCTRVSPGCDHCYAAVSRPVVAMGIKWGPGEPRHRTAVSTWRHPVQWNKSARDSQERWTVFPSLCDPFDNEVPEALFHDFMKLIAATPALTWLLLTKRIGNAARMLAPYRSVVWPNVWVGSSVVDQVEADRDIPKLLAVPAIRRFVSYEPALGPVDFTMFLKDPVLASLISTFPPGAFPLPAHLTPRPAIDWLIIGGESSQGGAKARPFDIAWARQAVQQCKAAGVPCFVKQLGSTIRVRNDSGNEWPSEDAFDDAIPGDYDPAYQGEEVCIKLKDRAGSDPAEWPEDLRVQEFPK